MKKILLVSIIGIMLSFGIVLFIFVSNDHLECDKMSTTTYKENGEVIVSSTHICKEKFNF